MNTKSSKSVLTHEEIPSRSIVDFYILTYFARLIPGGVLQFLFLLKSFVTVSFLSL